MNFKTFHCITLLFQECQGFSIHRALDYLFNGSFMLTTSKSSQFSIIDLMRGESISDDQWGRSTPSWISPSLGFRLHHSPWNLHSPTPFTIPNKQDTVDTYVRAYSTEINQSHLLLWLICSGVNRPEVLCTNIMSGVIKAANFPERSIFGKNTH